MSFSLLILIGSIPDAVQKAKDYRNKAIELAREIGAKGELGISYLNLGLLHSAEGDKGKAKQYISEAVSLFEQCRLENSLRQAKAALESLK
jgi:tetratricopeptide (TPR) repeat protein